MRRHVSQLDERRTEPTPRIAVLAHSELRREDAVPLLVIGALPALAALATLIGPERRKRSIVADRTTEHSAFDFSSVHPYLQRTVGASHRQLHPGVW